MAARWLFRRWSMRRNTDRRIVTIWSNTLENERVTPSPEELKRRESCFDWYVDQLNNQSVVSGPIECQVFRCPCCGVRTLIERGGYDICSVCFWEDDGQDVPIAD